MIMSDVQTDLKLLNSAGNERIFGLIDSNADPFLNVVEDESLLHDISQRASPKRSAFLGLGEQLSK
jgi:hypothetical protein